MIADHMMCLLRKKSWSACAPSHVVMHVLMQELEAEEERLWEEQISAAKANAQAERERYRLMRQVCSLCCITARCSCIPRHDPDDMSLPSCW
jgi:hypothetical protein